MPEKNKIIIVDDEPQALASFLLTSLGKDFDYRFYCEKPYDAVEYCANHTVEAAFLDIRMPNISGVDLAHEILKVNKTVKIIFITAFTFDEKAIRQELGDRVLGFAYKPFDPVKLSGFFAQIEDKKMDVFLKTFAPFDLFIDGEAVDFSSAKSKELLALLTVFNGSTLTLEQSISRLWPNHDIDLSKRLYRDAKIRLKSALEEAGVPELVSFGYGYLRINKEYAHSDYWDFLDEKIKPYAGIFMTGYEWAKEYKYPMDLKIAGIR
ncbi:MAG: response regulator [Bacilli bacterium]|nr:response regulator [Bacilli bacterium]